MSLGRALAGLLVASALPALAAAEPSCPPFEPRPDAALARLVDPIVDSAMRDGFAGGVAVMRGGELVYDRAAGASDARGRVPVTRATLFHVASITKYLTASLVLRAAETGRLDLDASVVSLVSGTALAERGVTFLDLLTHRSGLGSSYAAESETDPTGAIAAIDAQEVDAHAVGRFRYSNDGYDLLAILLERVYDRRYEQVAHDEVFSRACLEAPRFWAEVDLTDPHVVGQPLRKVSARLRRRNYGMLGSAGLLMRAADLVRFQHGLWNGQLLSRESVDTLLMPRDEISIGKTALGAFLVDHPVLGRVVSVRGYEDWGDNAILNHYLQQDIILAVVTSKGPAEKTGLAPFRTRISEAIEGALAQLRSK